MSAADLPEDSAELRGDAREGAGGPPGRVAVITLAHGRHDHLAAQLAGLRSGTRAPDVYVVAAMDDDEIAPLVAAAAPVAATTEVLSVVRGRHGLPLASARNAAAAAASRAGAEVLVFLDVDCVPGPDLVARYLAECGRHVAEHGRDAVGHGRHVVGRGRHVAGRGPGRPAYPQVFSGAVHYLPPRNPGQERYTATDLAASRPHPARPVATTADRVAATDLRLFWSLSFAITATDWTALGGFDEGYEGYGGEDTDFAMRVDRADGALWWVRGAPAYHQHHLVENPPVRHLADIVRNSNRFHERWGVFPMEGWLSAFEAEGLITLGGSPPAWRPAGAGRRSARSD